MNSFAQFMKKNKVQRNNVKYAATKSLLDENGKPLLWELKPLTTKQNEDLRDKCTVDVPVSGKPNLFRPKLVTKMYVAKLIAASVVYPDLYNKELQDSYGVTTPEDLLLEMVDDPAEYNEFVKFVQDMSGFENMSEKVDEAKN